MGRRGKGNGSAALATLAILGLRQGGTGEEGTAGAGMGGEAGLGWEGSSSR